MAREPLPNTVLSVAPASIEGHRLAAAALLVLIGTITAGRLIGLDQLLPWHDEAHTLLRVFGHPVSSGWALLFSDRVLTADELLRLQRPDPALGLDATWRELAGHPEHAPLYYLLGWVAARLPLEPLAALRGTSASVGLLLPAAAFWLMRELFGRGPAPWVAALLVACSPLHLLYAQEARQYALWTLLVVTSSAALLRALRLSQVQAAAGKDHAAAPWERFPIATGRAPGSAVVATASRSHGTGGAWALYALLLTLGLYSHLLFAPLLAVHAAYAWLAAAGRSGRLLRPAGLPWRPWLLAVGSALLLFLPWLIVVVNGLDQAVDYTSWMSRRVEPGETLLAWGQLLARSLVDLWPTTPPARVLVLLLPIAVGLVWYLLKAPRPSRWLLPLVALACAGLVLVPDLLFGGVRSLHGRYALPALLAVQLMLAWTLGSLLVRQDAGRPAAIGTLVAVVLLGLASQQHIRTAATWWTKNPRLSAQHPAAIAMLHAQPLPFLLVGADGLALGQALAVAHGLDERVRILGFRRGTSPELVPPDLDRALLLVPTHSVRVALGPRFRITPLGSGTTWALASAEAMSPSNNNITPKVSR